MIMIRYCSPSTFVAGDIYFQSSLPKGFTQTNETFLSLHFSFLSSITKEPAWKKSLYYTSFYRFKVRQTHSTATGALRLLRSDIFVMSWFPVSWIIVDNRVLRAHNQKCFYLPSLDSSSTRKVHREGIVSGFFSFTCANSLRARHFSHSKST